jgi:polysaccharide pyruvyl transferase WcaK-like protein
LAEIVIVSHHSDNRGDEAALMGLITSLKEEIPDAKFTVLATSPEGTSKAFEREQLTVLEWIYLEWIWGGVIPFRVVLKVSRYRTCNILANLPVFLAQGVARFFDVASLVAWAVLRRYGRKISMPICAKKQRILEAFAKADIVLFSPGGPYFGDLYREEVPIHVIELILAKILRKPVMICAPSMGPFNRTAWICRHVLNEVDVITLRDDISARMLAQLRLSKPFICVTADCGVLQHPVRPEVARRMLPGELSQDPRCGIVGITVMPIMAQYLDYSEYKRIMARVADYVISKTNAKVLFVPQVKSSRSYEAYSDLPLIEQILALMSFKKNAYIIPEDYHADEMHGIFGTMDFLVGARYHGAVLAATMGVPSILIAYEHKAKGFMRSVGLDEFVVDARELSFESLAMRIDKLLTIRDQVGSILDVQIREIRSRALNNVTLVTELLKYSWTRGQPRSFKTYMQQIRMRSN